jgi:hypothetical protein
MPEQQPSERTWIMRKTKLSKGAVMLFELSAADLYDISGKPALSDDFLHLFVGIVSGSEASALDLNRAWEEAAARLKKMKPVYPKVLMDIEMVGINITFDSVMEAIVHDEGIANQAQLFRKHYERITAARKR